MLLGFIGPSFAGVMRARSTIRLVRSVRPDISISGFSTSDRQIHSSSRSHSQRAQLLLSSKSDTVKPNRTSLITELNTGSASRESLEGLELRTSITNFWQ